MWVSGNWYRRLVIGIALGYVMCLVLQIENKVD